MAIYTKTGDNGFTSLHKDLRLSKDDIRVHLLGEMDETNSFLGLLRSKLSDEHEWQIPLRNIQQDLMKWMSVVAKPQNIKTRYNEEDFEKWIDQNEQEMPASKFFILPGGNEVASLCHVLRTKVRGCERRLVEVKKNNFITEEYFLKFLKYLNRLSDLFFSLARLELHRANLTEEKWKLFQAKDH